MPVPDFDTCDLSRFQAAARAYRAAATEFTATIQKATAKSKSSAAAKKSAKTPAGAQLHLGFPGQPADEKIAATRDRLRALHWRVDAEVLRLYALPPELERELLDAFDGVPRVGVPFEQTRYIPREFRDVLTLDDFLRITDEWDTTESRRCELIEKRLKTGRRTTEEEAEFRQLQRLLTLHRRFYSPLPTSEIKALTQRLKEGREWEYA